MPVLALLIAFLALAAAASPAPAASIAVARVQCKPCLTGITVLRPDGTQRRQLTGHAGWYDDDPDWSPDGRRIVFSRTSDNNRSYGLFVIRADGSGLRRLTRGGVDWRPAWSPDGRWIVYQSTSGIRLVRPDGRQNHLIPRTRGAYSPSWAPGGRVAFTQGAYIFTSRSDGGGRHRLVRGREPDWSPNGRVIAYTGPDGGVFTMPAAGGRSRMVHTGMQPDWSPDGRRIAFTRWGADFAVWTMSPDGTRAQRVMSNARAPAWSR